MPWRGLFQVYNQACNVLLPSVWTVVPIIFGQHSNFFIYIERQGEVPLFFFKLAAILWLSPQGSLLSSRQIYQLHNSSLYRSHFTFLIPGCLPWTLPCQTLTFPPSGDTNLGPIRRISHNFFLHSSTHLPWILTLCWLIIQSCSFHHASQTGVTFITMNNLLPLHTLYCSCPCTDDMKKNPQ